HRVRQGQHPRRAGDHPQLQPAAPALSRGGGSMSAPPAWPPSWYAASAAPPTPRPALAGVVGADVCVVGAGFTGLSAALHLVERGYRVVVLEAARVGWGASGRNGGQMVNGYSRDIDVIERRHGPDAARALGAMMFEG